MDKIAVFDMDYTLTSKETQVEFLKFFLMKFPYKFYYAFNSLFGFLGYFLKIHDEKKSKEIHNKFLKGLSENELSLLSDEFYETHLKKIFYKDALKEMEKLHKEGFRIIISSASPEFYVKKLEKIPYVEKALGTEFDFYKNYFNSRVKGKNHKGKAKVERLLNYLQDEKIDFKNSLMYSDSLSDLPLLKLMGKGYLINYNKKTDFEILHWR